MGFLLICLAVAIVIGAISFLGNDYKIKAGLIGTGVMVLLCSIVCLCIWGCSYGSYVDNRTFFDATREQYANAVQMYRDYALLDLKGAAAIAFTDLKYQGYQENMAKFINDLKRQVVNYNEAIVSKRVMKRNFIFKWMIIAPDNDMKIIKMTANAAGAAQ